jgi:hypothetical protein
VVLVVRADVRPWALGLAGQCTPRVRFPVDRAVLVVQVDLADAPVLGSGPVSDRDPVSGDGPALVARAA